MEAAATFRHRRLRIGALLLRSGLLSADKLAEALEEKEQTGERIGEIVVRHGWVTESQVAQILADQFDLPFVDLAATRPEARVESLLSASVARYFRAVPIELLDEQTVLVAVSDPSAVSTEQLQSAMGLQVRLAVATESGVADALGGLDPDTSQPSAEATADVPGGSSMAVAHPLDEPFTPELAPPANEPPAGPLRGPDEPTFHLTTPIVSIAAPTAEPTEPAVEVEPPPTPAQLEPALPWHVGAPLTASEPEPAARSDGGDWLARWRPDPADEPDGGTLPVAPAEEPLSVDASTAEPAAPATPIGTAFSWLDRHVAPIAEPPLPQADPVAPPPIEAPEASHAGEATPAEEPARHWRPWRWPAAHAGPEALDAAEPEGLAAETAPAAADGDAPAEASAPRLDLVEPLAEISLLRLAEPAAPAAPDPPSDERAWLTFDLPEPDPEQAEVDELPATDGAAGDQIPIARDVEATAHPATERPPIRFEWPALEDVDTDAVVGPEPGTDDDDDIPPLGDGESFAAATPVDTLVVTEQPTAPEPTPPPFEPTPLVFGPAPTEPAAPLFPPVVAEPQPIVAELTGLAELSVDAPLVPLSGTPVAHGPIGGAMVPLFEHRRPQLGTILLRNGLVTPDQLAAALEEKEESGARLGQILLTQGALSEVQLARALAEQHNLEFHDLASAPPNAAVASLLPERYARRYRAVPVRYLENDGLLVAVADPTDVIASDDLRIALGVTIQLAVTTETDLQAVLDRVHGIVDDDATVTVEQPAEADQESDTSATGSGFRRQGPIEVLEATTNAPAIELVNEVVKRAIQEGASDIHFEPQSERTVVRARIDGVMRELRIIPKKLQQAVSARLKIMGELDIAERRAPQDGRVTITFGGRPIDLRIAVLPTLHGEQVVIRVLYRSSHTVDLADLGLAPDTEAAIRHAIAQPYGALLSVGPTGSGKTTTLYAALGLLNTEDRCLMTIEDPVEYQLEGLNQVQVNVKAGLTFAQGLRTILRSDPDVLLVGEIRDPETAKIAVQAAMTGHLVLSTVHADNVGSAVSRLADMGVERQLLASTINVIFAQRLARKLCTSCREPYELDTDLLAKAGADERVLPPTSTVTLYRARGCGQCMGGYKGRIGLFETLLVTPKMRRLMETATAEEIYETAVADGMRTLQDDGLRLSLAGLTSLEEIKRVAGERRI